MAESRKHRRLAPNRAQLSRGLNKLKSVLSPPVSCRYHPNVAAERKLQEAVGQSLPSSYFEFLACYGPGYVRTTTNDLNFLTVYGPARILQQNQVFYNALGEPLPRPHWPHVHWTQQGGWLMWGYSCDGHQYYWRREGEPKNWPIVVEDRHSEAREEFDLNLPEFLYAVLKGTINPSGVPLAIKSNGATCTWVQSPE